jgi:hypothetical protein
MEDAERKYMDILDNEKQTYKKREQASKEIIQELSKKLKVRINLTYLATFSNKRSA